MEIGRPSRLDLDVSPAACLIGCFVSSVSHVVQFNACDERTRKVGTGGQGCIVEYEDE